jgi:hypothetical protein
MYRVRVQLDNGKFIIVADRDALEGAVQLIEGLNAHWPRQYVVCDSEGKRVNLARHTPMKYKGGENRSPSPGSRGTPTEIGCENLSRRLRIRRRQRGR